MSGADKVIPTPGQKADSGRRQVAKFGRCLSRGCRQVVESCAAVARPEERFLTNKGTEASGRHGTKFRRCLSGLLLVENRCCYAQRKISPPMGSGSFGPRSAKLSYCPSHTLKRQPF